MICNCINVNCNLQITRYDFCNVWIPLSPYCYDRLLQRKILLPDLLKVVGCECFKLLKYTCSQELLGVQKKDVVNWLFSRDVKFPYDLTTLEIFHADSLSAYCCTCRQFSGIKFWKSSGVLTGRSWIYNDGVDIFCTLHFENRWTSLALLNFFVANTNYS